MHTLKHKYYLFIISPLAALTIPWILNLFLFKLQATINIQPIPFSVSVFFFFIFILFLLIHVIFRVKNVRRKLNNDFSVLNIYFRGISLVWLLGSLFEIYYSKGLPIIWSLQGSVKDYTDFGIPSLHGLMNSLYFFLVASLSFQYFHNRNRKTLFKLLLVLLWPIMMLGRGIFLTALVQVLSIYLFTNRLNIKVVSRTVILSVLTVISFGIIGGMRGGYKNPFSFLVSDGYQAIFDYLPNGFLWVYIYITSPLSNYIFNVIHTEPIWEIKHSLVNLLPSVLRSDIVSSHNFSFDEASLNVSTIFASSHSDLGFYGDTLLMLLLVCWSYFWFRKLKYSPYYILPYSMVFCVLLFSVFYNLFLLQTYIVSTLLQGFVAYRCHIRSTFISNHKS